MLPASPRLATPCYAILKGRQCAGKIALVIKVAGVIQGRCGSLLSGCNPIAVARRSSGALPIGAKFEFLDRDEEAKNCSLVMILLLVSASRIARTITFVDTFPRFAACGAIGQRSAVDQHGSCSPRLDRFGPLLAKASEL